MRAIWIDAQLSPSLAPWISSTVGIPSKAVRELGLREAQDYQIFQAARQADAIVMTKDADFPHLLSQHGPSPRVLWITCGNTSKRNLRKILQNMLEPAMDLIESGESLVEITAAGTRGM